MLRHCLPASIRQTLNQLPKSLDDTYLGVLRQIPEVNQAHAHRMLECLVVAVRPLSVEELAELLAFEFDTAPGGIPKYRPALRLDNQTQAVLSTCSSLVTIIDDEHWLYGRRQIVQFSHFSVKEFLVSNRLAPSIGDISRYHIRLGHAHTTLTQACLGLLLHSDNQIAEGIVEASPLAGYGAEHWVEHAQFEDVASHVKDAMETLFDPDKPHFETWVKICDIDPNWGDIPERASPLYYSAICGFYDLTEHLAIQHPQYVNAFGGAYEFPLLAALGQGHVEVAELLLKRGAYVHVRSPTGMTTLLMAILWPEENDIISDAVEFLLTHGADVNAWDDTFTTSLNLAEECYAMYHEMGQVVTILLKHGADVNLQDNNGKTPLHRLLESEMYYDSDECCSRVRLLLEHGAVVNRRDKDNQTPLLLAMECGWLKAVRILIEHGADSIAENKEGHTPLHILSRCDINSGDDVQNLVLLLLRHGAEVNRRDKNNETPLHWAIRRNQFELAEILLEHGADAIVENNQGQMPLHILSESDTYSRDNVQNLVLSLLRHGAKVNNRDQNNQIPLHLAIRRNRFELVKILLEHGADAIAENNEGQTSLHILSESDINSRDDVQNLALLLLRHGAKVNCRDKNNQTPLHLAMPCNRFELAGILLEHGADADAQNYQAKTPLRMLAENWSYQGGDLARGPGVNRQEEDNKSSLPQGIGEGKQSSPKLLLSLAAQIFPWRTTPVIS